MEKQNSFTAMKSKNAVYAIQTSITSPSVTFLESFLKNEMKVLAGICWVNGLTLGPKISWKRRIHVCLIVLYSIYSFTSIARFSAKNYTIANYVFPLSRIIANFFLTLGCASTSILLTFCYHEEFQHIIMNFGVIDCEIGSFHKSRFSILWKCLLLERLQITLFLGYDIYMSIKLLKSISPSYIHRVVKVWLFDNIRVLVFWLALEIADRFTELNQLLVECAEDLQEHRNDKDNAIYNVGRLRTVSKLQCILCDQVQMMSKIFGLAMFLDVVMTIAFITEFTYNIVFNAVNSQGFESIDQKILFAAWIAEFAVSITLK